MALSKQDVFNKVSLHLLKQYARSSSPTRAVLPNGNSETLCKYRGDNGLMCAIGCLIPDELYDPSIEQQIATSVIGGDSRLSSLFEENAMQRDFLNKLQVIHDQRPLGDWYYELVNFAAVHELNTDVLHIKDAV